MTNNPTTHTFSIFNVVNCPHCGSYSTSFSKQRRIVNRALHVQYVCTKCQYEHTKVYQIKS